MNTSARPWLLAARICVLCLGGDRLQAQEAITFEFSGFIEFEQTLPVPGVSVGDQFRGTYTFNPLAPGVPQDPLDYSLDTEYWAITSWSVTIPAKGFSFGGLSGEIAVGNNTLYQHNDRYVVTMFPGANAPVIGGHSFRFFQIDLYDPDFGGANLLQSSSLPLVPPDLELAPAADRRGRFVFNDASFQNRMTSLTLVPEPSTVTLMLAGGALAILQLSKRKRAQKKRGEGARLRHEAS